MALVKSTLSAALYNAFITAANSASQNDPNGNTILQTECDSLADAIDTFVKSGTVIVPGAGLLDAESRPITGAATGTIS